MQSWLYRNKETIVTAIVIRVTAIVTRVTASVTRVTANVWIYAGAANKQTGRQELMG